jgi:hypothetical protein
MHYYLHFAFIFRPCSPNEINLELVMQTSEISRSPNVCSSFCQLSISKLWSLALLASVAHPGAWSPRGREIPVSTQMLWFPSWGIRSNYHFVAPGEPSCSYRAQARKGGALGILELHLVANYGAHVDRLSFFVFGLALLSIKPLQPRIQINPICTILVRSTLFQCDGQFSKGNVSPFLVR